MYCLKPCTVATAQLGDLLLARLEDLTSHVGVPRVAPVVPAVGRLYVPLGLDRAVSNNFMWMLQFCIHAVRSWKQFARFGLAQ